MVGQSRPAFSAGALAFFVFALSGCSGLIYQSIWSQYLGLFLGHAAYAQSLVLAIFMGGMALGAWSASRVGHWRNLLRAYAWTELAIGVAAALFHPEYLAATGFAYDTAFPALSSSVLVDPFKWALASALILPQSILLGMTFPLMSNGLMRRLRIGDGAILSGLYFTNSIGAAAGALIATFVLMPTVGLPGAMLFGALLNGLTAVVAFMLSRKDEDAPSARSSEAGAPQAVLPVQTLLMLAALITGATSFVYEMGWIRMLSLAFGSTVHSFELMLAAFIGGLAFGGLWIRRRIDGYESPLRVGGYVQVLMGLAALTSLALYAHSFDWVAWLLRALSRDASAYLLYNVVTALVAIVIMVPAAFFAGMTLPLFTLCLIRSGRGEASVGRVYAANTLGAIIGVFLAMHLLIPDIGLKLAMIVAAAGDIVLGLVLLRRTRAPTGDTPRYLATIAISGIALAGALAFARFDPAVMASGVYRTGIAHIDPENERVFYYKDGKTSSVAVIANRKNDSMRIVTNGKADAALAMSDDRAPSGDELTMIMLGALPLSLHPAPSDVANIGFGSGLTVHTLLGDSRVKRVDTIEIEPAMYEGAKAFGERVERAYTDQRAHVHFEDAKAYFASHDSKYDVIVSEPSNPWVSGVASLFTREFYRFVPRHLNKGGLFVQWIQLYEINEELVASIVNALNESFADFRVFLSIDYDMIIVARADGPVGPLRHDAFDQPGVRSLLARIGITDMQTYQSHAIGDRASFMPFMHALSRRVNSDFHPILSLEAPKTRFMHVNASSIPGLAIADLPLLRSVGIDAIAEVPAPYLPFVERTGKTAAAASIATAMSADGDAEQGPAGFVGDIALLRQYGLDCNNYDEAAIVGAIHQLAAATIPFLDVNQLDGLWISPQWMRCKDTGIFVGTMLKVAAALSRGDGKTVRAAATDMLSRFGGSLPPEIADYLLRAAMLGAIMDKDFAAVATIDDSVGRNIAPSNRTYLQRVYLKAYADAAASGALSGD